MLSAIKAGVHPMPFTPRRAKKGDVFESKARGEMRSPKRARLGMVCIELVSPKIAFSKRFLAKAANPSGTLTRTAVNTASPDRAM